MSCKPVSSLATRARSNPAPAKPRALSKPKPRLAPVTTASCLAGEVFVEEIGKVFAVIVELCRTCTTTAFALTRERYSEVPGLRWQISDRGLAQCSSNEAVVILGRKFVIQLILIDDADN